LDLQADIARYRDRADTALLARLPAATPEHARLQQAMRYAVTVGGKRVRPMLCYATGEALGAPLDELDAPACALELVHAYSLVHDDLPAMDDDDLRRGQPTCHIQFDEATAILAGDALQALAFNVLAESPLAARDPASALEMIRVLGDASGASGMALGQAIDLAAVGQRLTLAQLEHMHRHKTGALIRASVRLGALTASADAELLTRLDDYAAAVGLAFQIADDILDVVADTATLGKTQGADAALDKPTYPALLGLEGARRHAADTHEQAIAALAGLGDRFELLRQLSAFVVERSH
jgi:geranylgeranyl pyrophosphate synthase